MVGCLMREINLIFKGITYTVSDKRAFALGEQVEEIMSLADISAFQKNPKMFKLAKAFATMLRFAGAKVTNEDVMQELVGGADREAAQARAGAAMSDLIAILTWGAQGDGGGDVPEKTIAS
jgi:hypothetical protein